MYKQSIAIFLTVLFMAFIVAPTIIVAVDDSVDVSILFGSCEEEEKENEKNSSLELIASNSNSDSSSLSNTNGQLADAYYFKPYPRPDINLISPPPDFLR